jgi:hypothetical protein
MVFHHVGFQIEGGVKYDEFPRLTDWLGTWEMSIAEVSF